MVKKTGFWESVERYLFARLAPLSPLLPWIVLAIVITTLTLSAIHATASLASSRSLTDVVVRAVQTGDYAIARRIWEEQPSGNLEDLVYPERVVEREINRYQELLEIYPGDFEIYLVLADLYSQIGEQEESSEYWERARILDPNNEIFNSQIVNSQILK